jgi:hypothetical protein
MMQEKKIIKRINEILGLLYVCYLFYLVEKIYDGEKLTTLQIIRIILIPIICYIILYLIYKLLKKLLLNK